MPDRILKLGNRHAAVATKAKDGTVTLEFTESDGETVVGLPDDLTLGEAFATITAAGGVWDSQATEPPTWVASKDWPTLAALLAEHYDCEARK